MLIAVDIGNSHVRLGGFHGDDLTFVASIATDDRQTGEQYACTLRGVFALYGVDCAQICGVALSSVVPAMVPILQKAFSLLTDAVVLSVLSGVKTGLNIKAEQPRAVGSDRVANAVWAAHCGKLPCVVVDLGTATTFTVLDEKGTLVGSVITAGVKTSLDTLKSFAAQLPAVPMQQPAHGVLGRNTIEAMQAGALYGAAALIDGMVQRIAQALGAQPNVLLTGGTATLIAPHLETAASLDPHITLRGLNVIWGKNQKG